MEPIHYPSQLNEALNYISKRLCSRIGEFLVKDAKVLLLAANLVMDVISIRAIGRTFSRNWEWSVGIPPHRSGKSCGVEEISV